MTIRIDAHCHLWRLDRGDYGWLDGDSAALAPIRRDFGLADRSRAAAPFAVDGAVAVQAAPTVAETEFLLSQARDPGSRILGVVGWVDLADPAAVADLERLAGDRRFVGVRPMLHDLPEADWIATRPAPACLAALKRLGLRFDALVRHAQLPALVRFAAAHGDLPMMIDHAAKPAFGTPAEDPRHGMWRDAMRTLAAMPHTRCKLSGLLTELPAELCRTPDQAVATLRPVVEAIFEWFGPERLAWGSDWPVLTLAATPSAWAEVTDTLLAPLDTAAQAAIRGGTAQRFYGLETGGAA